MVARRFNLDPTLRRHESVAQLRVLTAASGGVVYVDHPSRPDAKGWQVVSIHLIVRNSELSPLDE